MKTLTITNENFETEVMKSNKPVLLDFWAPWCAPCRMVSPIVDAIANEVPDIKVGKVNVDQNPELATTFGATSIPMLLVIKEGRVINKTVGAKPKKTILQMLGK